MADHVREWGDREGLPPELVERLIDGGVDRLDIIPLLAEDELVPSIAYARRDRHVGCTRVTPDLIGNMSPQHRITMPTYIAPPCARYGPDREFWNRSHLKWGTSSHQTETRNREGNTVLIVSSSF
eukprot:TRINITY_DN1244_c0_g2_i2.p1 TRINITY_DN1244_c0_g2~~TRINITY_DN1244_c0_g2_i2.p1  ORF type:complete len:125 (+),score=13.69 TRINITY_DN1244_c0_g2_i2:307-681(+)